MTKLKIYQFPDQVLAQKAEPIGHIDKSLFKIADDMLETMYAAPGAGLAANQVGILKRICVLDTDFDLDEIPETGGPPPGTEVYGNYLVKNKKPRIIINPEIIVKEGKLINKEACLSVPEFSAEVTRYEKIKLQYQNIDGITQTISAEGYLAIAIQHELDHLDGRLFIDRLSPLKKERIKKKLMKLRKSDIENSGSGNDPFNGRGL